MPEISNELISLLNYLLPGFIVAWFIYSFTSHQKPSQFERVIQALIYSIIVFALVTLEKKLLIYIESHYPSFTMDEWNQDTTLFFSLITAFILGLTFCFSINNDFPHSLIRRLKISNQISQPTNWHYIFNNEKRYIILHLKDDLRLYGWPLMWPSRPNDFFLMTKCVWLSQTGESNEQELLQDFIINISDVKWVETVPNEPKKGDTHE